MEKAFKVDQLSIQIYHDKYQMGQAAADMAGKYICDAISKKGEAVIILATGASQFEFLDSLTTKKIDWKKVVAFHLDEYVGLPASHPASFRRYLRERIIDKVGIERFFPIEGNNNDPVTECERLGNLLEHYSVDVAFVGIGENGHLAFNDPPASFNDKVKYKVVALDLVCRKQQVGEGWFKTIDEVPKQAITMTIPTIMSSQAIICTVPDVRKAEAVKRVLTQAISPAMPASILRRHPETMLVLDRYSASLLNEAIIGAGGITQVP